MLSSGYMITPNVPDHVIQPDDDTKYKVQYHHPARSKGATYNDHRYNILVLKRVCIKSSRRLLL
jgi:hypothetical protein